tara:strand:- start:81 stop:716 length:636 start_codon:yes stop_codon:yes gene_type:complete
MWRIHQEKFDLLSSRKEKKLYLDNKIQECGSRISILESGKDLALYSGEPAPSEQKIAVYRIFLSAMKNSNFRLNIAYSDVVAEIKYLQGIEPVPSNSMTENKNNILKKSFNKVYKNINISDKRKPHTAFAEHAKIELNLKRGEAWRKLGQLADQSKGENQLKLPYWGLIYLKRDKEKNKLRYKNTKFDGPKDGELITMKAFQSAWQRIKKQ